MLAGLKGSWEAANKPLTDLPTQAAQKVARPLTDWGMNHPGILGGMARGAGAFGESLGSTLSDMTSPLSLGVTMATGGLGGGAVGAGEGAALREGPAAMQGLRGAIPAASKIVNEVQHAPVNLPAEMLEYGGEDAYNVARQGWDAARRTMTEGPEAQFSKYVNKPPGSPFQAMQDTGVLRPSIRPSAPAPTPTPLSPFEALQQSGRFGSEADRSVRNIGNLQQEAPGGLTDAIALLKARGVR